MVGLVQKWGVAMLYCGFSGDPLWCSIENLGEFIIPLLTKMCYKIIAGIKYEMSGTVIVLIVLIIIIAVVTIHSVDSFNSCSNYSCK